MTHDVVVLLGSSWAELEHHRTRWRSVVTEWRSDARVGRLTVVDYPAMGRQALLHPAEALPSWLDGVTSLRAGVGVDQSRAGLLDGFAWRVAARRLAACLGRAPSLAIAATPLWVPVLRHLGASRVGFDAVDDWLHYAPAARQRAHVERGYRQAAGLTVTTPSVALSDTLRAGFGFHATVVPNGVDLRAYEDGAAAADRDQELPTGLPERPFAVYVGSIEGRVDVDLLIAVARDVPVVVAGSGEPAAVERLVAGGVRVLGRLAPETIPALLHRASVGLVPHHVNELTASMDPLKTVEYLAAGLPVVTTPVPNSTSSGRVRVVEGSAAFLRAVRDVIDLPRQRSPDPVVAERGWDRIAARLLSVHLGHDHG